MGSRRHGNDDSVACAGACRHGERRFGCARAFWVIEVTREPGMGSRCHGNDDSVACAGACRHGMGDGSCSQESGSRPE